MEESYYFAKNDENQNIWRSHTSYAKHTSYGKDVLHICGSKYFMILLPNDFLSPGGAPAEGFSFLSREGPGVGLGDGGDRAAAIEKESVETLAQSVVAAAHDELSN